MKKFLGFCFYSVKEMLGNTLQEIASLSVEPFEGESLIVTVFEIKKSEV